MARHVLLFLSIIIIGGILHSEPLPPELEKLIKEYPYDTTNTNSLRGLQKMGWADTCLKPSDISIGKPVNSYFINYEILDSTSEYVPVCSLIIPTNYWYAPLVANGKEIILLEIELEGGNAEIFGAAGGIPKKWVPILRYMKDNPHHNPIIISYGIRRFLHIPEKDAYNLYYLNPKKKDRLGEKTSRNLNDANNSSIIFSFLKEDPTTVERRNRGRKNWKSYEVTDTSKQKDKP